MLRSLPSLSYDKDLFSVLLSAETLLNFAVNSVFGEEL